MSSFKEKQMPVVASRLSAAFASAPLVLALFLAGCGGQSDGNGAQVEMSNLQKADGTINDAMTDLDGVQVEGMPVADTGNGSAGGNATSAAPASEGNQTAASGDEEVVADQ